MNLVKNEPYDDGSNIDCGTSGTHSILQQTVPFVDTISGYNEEPEQSDVINDVEVDNASSEQRTMEYEELSPIDRRLREKRTYNEGGWTSVELKSLYDGIATYGTTNDALDAIHNSFCTTRSLAEVIAKVNEIRTLNSENAEDRVNSQSEYWMRTGYRNILPNPQRIIPPEINNWEAAIQRVNRQIRSHSDYAVCRAIKNAFLLAPKDAEAPTLYKVTNYCRGRGYGKQQSVSWQRLNEFFLGIIQHSRPLPPLNPLVKRNHSESEHKKQVERKKEKLKCAVALRIMDDVEDEASRSLSDSDKAIIRGWLANIKMRDLRDFLPDSPYSVDRAARMLLDPLRTGKWRAFAYNANTQINLGNLGT
ncbi:hypothetical protein DICVIV_10229 [Dictyocaulus viviparus]|uniref:Uncharacterized protein n=1 Tax=Dictyocaulus viviparus TaxID=29172 RepID=A0A0D8XN05_DICVI|nr:hypothetical protein DICVIV_10229 [Dictyocaulus viviparus]